MALVAVAVALAEILTGGASASTTKVKTRHVTFTFLGAPVSSTENVYDVWGSGFRGAGIQKVKLNKAGTAGTDTVTTYSAHGTVASVI